MTGMKASAMVGLLLALLAPADRAAAQDVERSQQHTFQVETLASGLEHPWSLAFLPDGGILITEREGRLRLFKDGELQSEEVPGVPEVVARGQGGLLDVALHPDFSENGLVYLSYAGAGDDGVNTEVARARFDGRALQDLEVIFRAEPKVGGGNHFGSRLVFAGDGTLYVTLGDRYSYMEEAQSLENHLGTIVRLNDDGSVPEDNPFVGREGARPEIFSYGHRNVQGLALHPETGALWSHEHGPQGGDELNILKPGANYGWPLITYGIDYSGAIISEETAAPGMEQPITYWVPSIAVGSIDFYNGTKFPKWQGNLLLSSLAQQELRRLVLKGRTVTKQEVLFSGVGRLRDLVVGPDGFVYIAFNQPDRIARLVPADAASNPAPTAR